MSDVDTFDFVNDPLDAVALRVLGALVEKEFTTPDNYPLSLNALTAACNQTSNREPVMDLEEPSVMAAVKSLIARSLVREVHRSDSRVKRYRHLLSDTLHMHPPEMAALCVLLLRGPQTVGEIKGRTGRMFEFIDLAHVQITLDSLVTFSTPLAVQLPRQPGQKEVRYAHTLGGEPQPLEPPTRTAAASAEVTLHPDRADALEQELAALRAEMAELRAQFEAFRQQFQ